MIYHVSEALAMLLWAGGILILVPLCRAHHDRAVRYLTAVLVLFAVSRLFALTQHRTNPISLIVLNLLVLAAAYYEVRFFRTALHQAHEAPPPRFRAETATVLTIAAVAIVAWALAPPYMRGNLAQPRYGANPSAFLFVTVLISYYISVSARVIWWIAQLTASIYRGKHASEFSSGPAVRLARGGFIVGIFVIGLSEALRLAADVDKLGSTFTVFYNPTAISHLQTIRPLVDLAIRIGHVGFYIGALIPILADIAQSVLVAHAQARDYKLLEPLWRAVTPAFPGIELRRGRNYQDRYYRRELETRDCIMLLGPYYSRTIADNARSEASEARDPEPYVSAALIRAALKAKDLGEEATLDPHPIPTSKAATREEDMTWLVAVAIAFDQATAKPALHA